MDNLIAFIALFAIVLAAALYLIRAKKKGQKCIGCPYAKECASKSCSCGSH